MEIRAKGTFDFDSVKALIHLNLFKKQNPKKGFYSMIILCGIIAALCIVISIRTPDSDLFYLSFVAIAIIIIEGYLYFILPKISYRSLAKMKNAENEYIFGDSVLKLSTKSPEYTGEAEIEYSMLVKAYETSEYFFIYQTKNQVILVDKTTVEGGKAAEIAHRLSSYMGKKYIRCKY